MTYQKFNATAPSRGRHVPRAGIAVAALAGCLVVAHPAPLFAQGEPEAAPARIGVGLLRALGLGQPEDATPTATTPTDAAPQRSARAAIVAEPPPEGATLYSVAPGDTLGSIASRIEGASVDWRGLCSINEGRIANCNAIEVGDVIVIPDGGRIGAAGATQRADNDAAAPSARVAAAPARPSPRPAAAASNTSGSVATDAASGAVGGASATALSGAQAGGVAVAGLADINEQSPAWQGIGGPAGLTVRLRSAPEEAGGQQATAIAAADADADADDAGVAVPDASPQGDASIEAVEPQAAARAVVAPAALPVVQTPSEVALAGPSVDGPQADAAAVAGADAVAESDAPPAEATQVAAAAPLANDADGDTATDAQNTPDAPGAPDGARVIAELRYGAGSLPMALRSYHMHRIEELGAAVRVSGHVAGLYSTGTTGGAFQRLEEGFEARAAGKTLRVSVTMSGPAGGVAALAYSTNDLGNSGWRPFALTQEPVAHSFDYTLPPLVHGNGDFVGIDPDPEGAGHAVVIHDILVEILGGNPA